MDIFSSIGDALFGSGPSAPNTSGEEAVQAQVLKDLEKGIPLEYIQEKYMGDFTPEQIKQIATQGRSELSNVSTDPRFKQAQLSALAQLQERSQDGYNIEDRAAINKMLSETAMQERAQRDALLANAQARGVGGSGNALAQQMLNQQGAAMRQNDQALNLAAEGRRRALEAVMASGKLGGEIQARDFDQQARVAAAQDSINQFNTQNLNARTFHNNELINQSRARNLDARQGLEGRNAQGQNQFAQNKFDNQATVAGYKYGREADKMNRKYAQYGAEQDRRNAIQGAIINGAIQGGIKAL